MSDHDTVAPEDAVVHRIAEKVRSRRELLDLDQDLARYGGPSRSTVSILENKGVWPLRRRTRSAWARALGWEPDAFERMERGEEPIEAMSREEPPSDDAAPNDGADADEARKELQVLFRNLRLLLDEIERRLTQ